MHHLHRSVNAQEFRGPALVGQDRGGVSILALLDMSVAFDAFCYVIVLDKLWRFGGEAWDWDDTRASSSQRW